MPRLREILSLTSAIRLKLCHDRRDLTVKFKDGMRADLRSRTSDMNVFYEIFAREVYHPPFPIDSASITRVLDIGGNVGYSTLLWLRDFPTASVRAYEPHPAHVRQLRKNVEQNGWSSRLTLRPVAAGCRPDKLYLTDEGAGSAITSVATGTVAVEMVDLFADVAGMSFDLVKIDIEGGEYPLLEDPRFRQLSMRYICLETHDDASRKLTRASGMDYAAEVLKSCGFETHASHELLWGRRV